MSRTNEEELELFADLIEPAAEILGDKAVSEAFSSGTAVSGIKIAIKNHKQAVIEILARIDGVPVEEYKISAVALPIRLIKLLNRPEVKDLFTLPDQKSGAERSGSAGENIKDGE